MEELTLKIGLFHQNSTMKLMVSKAENAETFQRIRVNNHFMVFVRIQGIQVRIGTKKWSEFGPILINLGPI